MAGTTTQQYVGNINGDLLEEWREVQNEYEAIQRMPSNFSRDEQKDHARRRTLVTGKILKEMEDEGGMRAVQARIMADNGAVFLAFVEG